MQPGDLITVIMHARFRGGREALLWDQEPNGRPFVRGRAVEGELLLFLGPGEWNTVRVLHPVHGIRLMHELHVGVVQPPAGCGTLAPDWRQV
jgi:hypothetical protein